MIMKQRILFKCFINKIKVKNQEIFKNQVLKLFNLANPNQ